MTASAPPRPRAASVVPSMGSTDVGLGGGPSPIRSPLNSIGALSFSPSPMTTTPSMGTGAARPHGVDRGGVRPPLSPRPIQRLAAMAAASVTRTSSMARLRSGACGLSARPRR